MSSWSCATVMDLLPARSTLENSTAPGNLRLTDMPAARATARTLCERKSALSARQRPKCVGAAALFLLARKSSLASDETCVTTIFCELGVGELLALPLGVALW